MRRIIVIAHDLRSSHNVGSLLRTAEGLGIEKVYMTGYTPYPPIPEDSRLPHEAQKIGRDIHKTALGAEDSQPWEHHENLEELILKLRGDNYEIVALEQTHSAIPLNSYIAPPAVALLLGNEVSGIPASLLDKIPTHLVIPMSGKKESFNVVQAAAMAMYVLRFS